MGEWIKVTAEDGHELGTYVARPAHKPVAALVVVQEIFGVNSHIRSIADSYAADGFLVVAPALFDRIEKPLDTGKPLTETMWQKREIENYLCQESVLLAYARHDQPDDLFGRAEADRRVQTMRDCIQEVTVALQTLGRPDPWSPDVKASDDFLNPLFDRFFNKLGLPNLLRKTDYHALARLVPKEKIDPEVIAKLDGILAVAQKAKSKET